MTTTTRFDLGALTITPGVKALVDRGLKLLPLIRRHQHGDWGDLSAEDQAENELALREGFRLLSSYHTAHGKVWIITEADRSYTTILLPEEY